VAGRNRLVSYRLVSYRLVQGDCLTPGCSRFKIKILMKSSLLCIVIGFLSLVDVTASARAESPTSIDRKVGSSSSEAVTSFLDSNREAIEAHYVWFHSHPELSFEEKETSARFADTMRTHGFEVTTGVGGYGVVAILENGEGPTVMMRTDLDALPVSEQTPVPFASTVMAKSTSGSTTGVMHACGHDVHMTSALTVSHFLASHRELWSGRLMVIGQPAEEKGAGARAMLDDGLFKRFKKPDYALALHVSADDPAGSVKLRAGFSLANVDSVDITMIGRGGHGSAPHATIDPIVQAAELIMSLQTIVSREIRPIDPAVVTVGSVHGGFKHNVIGDKCHLEITVRSYGDTVRAQLLASIERKAKAVALSYNAPPPVILISEGTPSLRNDDALAERMQGVFEKLLGKDRVGASEPSMGGEDFSRYGIAGVPILMYGLGSIEQARLDRYEKMKVLPPSLHSGLYYPDFEPTLRTGVRSMVAAIMDLMPPK
jgi:amidohydrolase